MGEKMKVFEVGALKPAEAEAPATPPKEDSEGSNQNGKVPFVLLSTNRSPQRSLRRRNEKLRLGYQDRNKKR